MNIFSLFDMCDFLNKSHILQVGFFSEISLHCANNIRCTCLKSPQKVSPTITFSIFFCNLR